MATQKQRKAIEAMVENGGKVSPAMKAAGYSEKTAVNPSKLTESKGFKELMEEYGLTDELIVTSLVADIKAKPGSRTPELTLASKIKGLQTDKLDITSGGDKITTALVEFVNGDN